MPQQEHTSSVPSMYRAVVRAKDVVPEGVPLDAGFRVLFLMHHTLVQAIKERGYFEVNDPDTNEIAFDMFEGHLDPAERTLTVKLTLHEGYINPPATLSFVGLGNFRTEVPLEEIIVN